MPLIDMDAKPVVDTWIDGALTYRVACEPLIVPIETLAQLSPGEVEEARPLGVRVTLDAGAERLFAVVDHLELIVVEFPSFRDGRGFTLAITLRNKHGFKGDLRASGEVLPDQFEAFRQCGFTTIETPSSHPPEQWRAARATGEPPERPTGPLLKRLLAGQPPRRRETLHLRGEVKLS